MSADQVSWAPNSRHQREASLAKPEACIAFVQKPIFALWIGTCGLVVVACLRSSDDTYNELFHIYYQPLIIMLAMFWLWGIAMRVFELMRVEYEACFSVVEQQHLLSSRQVYQVMPLESDTKKRCHSWRHLASARLSAMASNCSISSTDAMSVDADYLALALQLCRVATYRILHSASVRANMR